jgi:hypothetical protein
VRDEAHVGLVDAHAERDRRDHDHSVFAEEPLLRAAAHARIEARVVRQCVHAVRRKERGELLGARAGQRVDDARDGGARCIRTLAPDEVEQLLANLELGADAVLDVRTIEARDKMARTAEREPLGDLAMRCLGGGGGERDARHPWPALCEIGEGEVVGAEVVAPLGDAVRLVDGEERDGAAREEPLRRLVVQSLGRDVEQVELAREVGALDCGSLGRLLARVEVRRPHAVAHERIDLVVHQRDER